jgi:hypothetical protein
MDSDEIQPAPPAVALLEWVCSSHAVYLRSADRFLDQYPAVPRKGYEAEQSQQRTQALGGTMYTSTNNEETATHADCNI